MQTDNDILPTSKKFTKKDFTFSILKLIDINQRIKVKKDNELNKLAFTNSNCVNIDADEDSGSIVFNNCTYPISDSMIASEFDTCNISANTQSIDGSFSGSGNESLVNINYDLTFTGFFNGRCITNLDIDIAAIVEFLESYENQIQDPEDLTEEVINEIFDGIIDHIDGKVCGLTMDEMINAVDQDISDEETMEEICSSFE